MIKGKLSQLDKYTIQGMLHSQKSISEIATALDRTEKSIEKYVNVELDKIHNTISKVQIEEQPLQKPEKPIMPIVKTTLPRNQGKITLARLTKNGKDGVVAMTSASSAVGDDFHKELQPTRSRTSRGNLYNIDGNKLDK